ncbi:MAG TPA: TonB-dependent receptor, partial [Terriglobia bacterium]|nr:TonB-dependent receptor [Terriglobia bacterium]
QGLNVTGNTAYATTLPAFSFSRFQGTSGTNVNRNVQNTIEYTDNMTWIHGRHTFKWGFDIRHYQNNALSLPNNHTGAFSFGDEISGFDYANFLLGLPDSTTLSTPRPRSYIRSTLSGFYIQDDMRVSPRLTLNYGIRYEYQSPWTEKFDRRYSFDLATGSLVVAGTTMPTDLVPEVAATLPIETSTQAGFPAHTLQRADKNNFNPRIGIAYRPFGNSSTVVRLGYGWYTSMLPGLLGNTGLGGPWQTNTSFNYLGGAPTQSFPNPFTQSTSFQGVTSISVVDPSMVNERAQQWNVSVGHEFLGTAIDVAYVGTKTTHIPYTMDFNLLHPSTTPFDAANRPYQLFNPVDLMESGSSAIYHGLTIQADHRFKNGLQFNANYAWAKGMTDTSLRGYAVGFQQNQYDQALEYSRDPNVRSQQLRFDWIYELPIGRGKSFLPQLNPVLNQIIGGWQVVGITTMVTGLYLSPAFSGTDPANTNQYGGRPDCIGNGNLGNIGSLVRAGQPMFNLSAFALPAGGRGYYGNCARFGLVGPGTNLWNAGLSKNFMLHEGVRLQIQWELFNAWNHANFGNGNTNISSGNFGITSYGGGGRSMLFGGRIDF